jgi:hypothetical protein
MSDDISHIPVLASSRSRPLRIVERGQQGLHAAALPE